MVATPSRVKKVVWLVTESRINFVDNKEEWTDSRISFELAEQGQQTGLDFTHQGRSRQISCNNDCSGAWEAIIGKSLLSFITIGKGVEVFVKINKVGDIHPTHFSIN